jgi:hypothetical protein
MNMQDNSPNNWKILLETPQRFQGEILSNKNELWERLHHRLHKKPQRKMLIWYWAAACLLIVTIVSVAVFTSNGNTHYKEVPEPSIVKTLNPIVTGNSSSANQKKSENIFSQSTPKIHSAGSIQKNNLTALKKSGESKNIIDSIISELPELVITSSITANDSSALNTLTIAPPSKKKLRVVHLNEIGQPVEEPTVNTGLAEKHGLAWRIINAENYNPVYSSSTNNGLILTKPRSTSN